MNYIILSITIKWCPGRDLNTKPAYVLSESSDSLLSTPTSTHKIEDAPSHIYAPENEPAIVKPITTRSGRHVHFPKRLIIVIVSTIEEEEIDDNEGSIKNLQLDTQKQKQCYQSAVTGLKCTKRQMQHRSYFCARYKHHSDEIWRLKDTESDDRLF
ncbi:hypothetical protein AVEN_59331-1 [Araneus ventricosus]|uniref:Uncharacterized protein n=1 Tax=Araneus ventricosus TaxID=182803 RepID=A0A4Y2HP62_ARAVE|nr:hypothetical protein AVEN_59331-1 [Araneus ventricosus]